MDYNEFKAKYKFDAEADCVGQGRFGKVFKAAKVDGKEVYLRIMEVKKNSNEVTLIEETEFVKALAPNPAIVGYAEAYRFEHPSGDATEVAVMPYYPLGNMVKLMADWKLSDDERKALHDRIIAVAEFLRGNEVNLPAFDPATIFVTEEPDGLHPHFIDLSGVMNDNPDNERQVAEFLRVGEAEAGTAGEDINQPEGSTKRKLLLLMGIVLTWVAIIALIAMVHSQRNPDKEEPVKAVEQPVALPAK